MAGSRSEVRPVECAASGLDGVCDLAPQFWPTILGERSCSGKAETTGLQPPVVALIVVLSRSVVWRSSVALTDHLWRSRSLFDVRQTLCMTPAGLRFGLNMRRAFTGVMS